MTFDKSDNNISLLVETPNDSQVYISEIVVSVKNTKMKVWFDLT